MIIRTDATRRRFSRRDCLRLMGLSGTMLPLLDAEPAVGQSAGGFPKRIITITWTNGVCQSAFFPQDNNPVSGEVLQPLAPLASKVTLLAGLDYQLMLDAGAQYDGHFSYPVIFTGTYRNTGGQDCTSEGPSIDQVISDAIAERVNLPMPIMNVTLAGQSTSYRGADERNTGEDEPQRMFDRLFVSDAIPEDRLMAIRERRKSVLDFVGTELETFGGRMGTEGKAKIQSHLESIRQLELRLSASGAACMAPDTDTGADGFDGHVRAMTDIAAMAMRCDQTRVVSMVWGADGGSGPNAFPFAGVSESYHEIAHAGSEGYDRKITIDQWYYTQVANLAQQLEDASEAGGTALDNSVIVVANDMNEGSKHNIGGLPFVLIGGCGGALKTGEVIRLGDWATNTDNDYYSGHSGVPHNKLLATLCNAMDVPMDSFGRDYSGLLTELHA